jgi:hypothetical protein
MASPATSRPPVRRDAAPPRDGRSTPDGPVYRGLATSRTREGNRGVRLVAISVSALVHLRLIVLAPLLLRDGFQPISMMPVPADETDPILVSFFEATPPPESTPPPEPPPTPGRVPATAAATAPRPPLASPAAAPTPLVPATPGAVGDAVVAAPVAPPSAGAAEGGGTIAERLRPGPMDARLWSEAPKPGEFTPEPMAQLRVAEFTPEQLAQLQILWAILDVSDSLTAAEAARRKLTNWTFTDANGGRWGISEGGIHLGDLTIPFAGFSPTPGSPAAQRAWVDAQIDRSAAAATARANLNQRIKAIRERIERERRAVPPDTTRRRR